MHLILTLLRKDFLNFSKDRVAVSLTFLVPVVLIYIFGQVFGVTRTSSAPSGIPLAVVNESAAPEIGKLVAALRQETAFRVVESATDEAGEAHALSEAEVREGFQANRYRFALILPSDAMSDEKFGVRLKLLFNPRNDIESQVVMGLLQKTIYTEAPALLMRSLEKQAAAAIGQVETDRFYGEMAGTVSRAFGLNEAKVRESMSRGALGEVISGSGSTGGSTNFLEQLVKIEQEQLAGTQVKNTGATRAVGGWAMMFLLFALSGSATSLFDEKKAGLFLRLLASPVRRSHILWSKYIWGTLLGLVQLVALFFAGRLMFGIDVTSNFGNLLVICFAAAVACTGFGMLLAAITRTPAAAQGLATLLILTMSAVGGAWFPTSFMPEFIQQISKLTVVYWSMEGFMQVLWNDCTLLELLPTVGILFGIAGVLISVSLWRFKRGSVFE